MKKAFLSIVMVVAISLFASAMVFVSAMGSGNRVDMIMAQSTEQEAPSDQGTPQEEMGYDQGTAQDTESPQGICTDPADCPDQKEATPPNNK